MAQSSSVALVKSFTGRKKVRKSFACIPEVAEMPNLIKVQRQSYENFLQMDVPVAERLRAVGARHGRSPGEAAIAWTLGHPAVTAAIVGARSPKQVDGIIGALDFRLTSLEMAEVEGK